MEPGQLRSYILKEGAVTLAPNLILFSGFHGQVKKQL